MTSFPPKPDPNASLNIIEEHDPSVEVMLMDRIDDLERVIDQQDSHIKALEQDVHRLHHERSTNYRYQQREIIEERCGWFAGGLYVGGLLTLTVIPWMVDDPFLDEWLWGRWYNVGYAFAAGSPLPLRFAHMMIADWLKDRWYPRDS